MRYETWASRFIWLQGYLQFEFYPDLSSAFVFVANKAITQLQRGQWKAWIMDGEDAAAGWHSEKQKPNGDGG